MKEIWDEVAEDFIPPLGATGLAAVCDLVVRSRDAARRVEDEGMVVADDKGEPVEHPLMETHRDAVADLHRWLVRFARK